MKNNNPFVAGVADAWYSGSLNDLWVEYKYLDIDTPRNQVVPNLTKQQLCWLQGRHSEGRNVWVVVGSKRGGVIYGAPEEWEAGLSAFEFVDRLKDRKAIANAIQRFCNGEDNE